MLESWPSIIFSLELVSASVGTLTDLLRSVHTMKRHDMAAVSIQSADFTQLPRVRLQRSLLVPQEKASRINAVNTSEEDSSVELQKCERFMASDLVCCT